MDLNIPLQFYLKNLMHLANVLKIIKVKSYGSEIFYFFLNVHSVFFRNSITFTLCIEGYTPLINLMYTILTKGAI